MVIKIPTKNRIKCVVLKSEGGRFFFRRFFQKKKIKSCENYFFQFYDEGISSVKFVVWLWLVYFDIILLIATRISSRTLFSIQQNMC